MEAEKEPMSECKHEKSQECSGKKSKGNRSQDNSPERPKIGLLPIPIVTKEVLLPKPVLSKEGLLPVPVLSKEDILADVSKTGILADVLKPSPDLSKVAITELTKVIKDKVSPKIIEVISTEVVSKRTGLCKRCEGKEEAEKIAPRGGSLISNAPLGDGILNLLPNPLGLLKPDDSQNAVVTNGKVHNNENGKGNDNKPGQGIGFLPQPPHISIPFLPGEKNGIPGATDIFNPINLKPGNVIPDPTNLVKTFLVQPFINIVEHFLQKAFEKFKEVFNYFAKRPYLAMPLMVFLMALLTPVFLFILFAFMTTAVTFIGFIIAESTVLALGGVILVGFLVSIFSVVLMFVSTYGVTYIGLKTIRLVD